MAVPQQKLSKMSDSVLQKSIQIQRTDLSTFDDSFSFMKEKFAAEMRKMDEAMNKFSTDLKNVYGQSSTLQLEPVDPSAVAAWDTLTSSPLVQGEGETKTLKLQFDVSQFDPNEVKVQFLRDVLIVTATHQSKTDNSSVLREFRREFALPKGTNPEEVVSSLSRDGVLTVQAPLPQLMRLAEKADSAATQESKNSQNQGTESHKGKGKHDKHDKHDKSKK